MYSSGDSDTCACYVSTLHKGQVSEGVVHGGEVPPLHKAGHAVDAGLTTSRTHIGQRLAVHGPQARGEATCQCVGQPEPQIAAGAHDVVGAARLDGHLSTSTERGEASGGGRRPGQRRM